MKPIFALAIFALATGCVSSGGGSSIGDVTSLRSPSPTQMGAAIFTKHIGFQDDAVSFEVIDTKVGAKPIDIGFVGDAKWKGEMPKDAVWSKDGSVIAVQGADFKSWSHVYDFKQHDYALSDIYPLDKRAAAIEKLLQSRGGKGPKVLDDWANFDKTAKLVGRTT